jgi:hypothetical protein
MRPNKKASLEDKRKKRASIGSDGQAPATSLDAGPVKLQPLAGQQPAQSGAQSQATVPAPAPGVQPPSQQQSLLPQPVRPPIDNSTTIPLYPQDVLNAAIGAALQQQPQVQGKRLVLATSSDQEGSDVRGFFLLFFSLNITDLSFLLVFAERDQLHPRP